MNTKAHFYQFTAIFVILHLAGGCSLNKSQSTPTKLELAKERKKKRDQLYQELGQKILKVGTPAEIIREKFGEPDDIFKSGSSTGSIEVWTYDKILLNKEEKTEWESVLLYFDNSHLITWKY